MERSSQDPSRPEAATDSETTLNDATPKEDPAFIRQFNSFRNAVLNLVGPAKNGQDEEKDKVSAAKKLTEKNNARCERWKAHFLAKDPAVRFMMENLQKAGCPFDPAHIRCVDCDIPMQGGFNPEGELVLCQNYVFRKRQMEETVVHELIHAYDFCRYKVDFSNLYHHACTEIRAASLSGDCRFWNEFQRLRIGFRNQHQNCVRFRATLSVAANPSCPDKATAERVVNRVFESCFNDTAPFEEGIYY